MLQPAVTVLLLSAILGGFRTALAADQRKDGPADTTINANGATTILGSVAGSTLRAVITTHVVQIGRPGSPAANMRNTNCTYSRYPCSIVDRIDISVNGRPIDVKRSVFADLADLNRGRFKLSEGNRPILSFEGGDASESFVLDISLSKDRVLSRKRSDGEFPENYETTTYVVAPANAN